MIPLLSCLHSFPQLVPARPAVVRLCACIGALAWLAGCAGPGATQPPLQLKGTDTDQVYNVEQGRVIEVTLKTNPESGYHWYLERVDGPVLGAMGTPVYTPSPSMPAGGGVTTFRFKARKPGRGMIRIAYRQPWEQTVKGETFVAMVQVR